VLEPDGVAITDALTRAFAGRRITDRTVVEEPVRQPKADIGYKLVERLRCGIGAAKKDKFVELARLCRLHPAECEYRTLCRHGATADPALMSRLQHLLATSFTADEAMSQTECEVGHALDDVDTALAVCRQTDRQRPRLSAGEATRFARLLGNLAARVSCVGWVSDRPHRREEIAELVSIGKRALADPGVRNTADGLYPNGLLNFPDWIGEGGWFTYWKWDHQMCDRQAELCELRFSRSRRDIEAAMTFDPTLCTTPEVLEHLALQHLCSAMVAAQAGLRRVTADLDQAWEVIQQA
jgi:hypothetical protein